MAITDYLAGYPGRGQPSYLADSGEASVSTDAATVTATFAASADPSATQPQIKWIKFILVMYTMGTAKAAQIDFTMDDGTYTVHVGSVAAPVSADTNPVQIVSRAFDSGLTTLTNIINVNAIIATTVDHNFKARLYAVGGD
jgi:hypothetical protein